MIAQYLTPAPEYAFTLDRQRKHRLLIIASLFDEGNKTRHWLIETMRRLDALGVDSFLPDLPGCNESASALNPQTLESWRAAMRAAADHFAATAVLAIRGGSLLLDGAAHLPMFQLAPQDGPALLRSMLRARMLADRELGFDQTTAALLTTGISHGLALAGYRLGAAMIAQLNVPRTALHPAPANIEQSSLGGSPLWLRAEPAHDAAQADALAAIMHGALQA